MKVTLLAWSRESGGAERQLVNLACGLRRRGHDVLVVVFFPNEYVQAPLLATDTPVLVLGVRGRWDAWRYLVRFVASMSKRDHEVVYSFLQFPNLLTVPLKLFQGQSKMVWGFRSSDLRISLNILSHMTTWLEKRLSGFADLIIVNSFHGCRDAIAFGFNPGALTMIHNGIDTRAFRPDPDGGLRIRAKWGVASKDRLIGLVGRMEAKKDHGSFLRAAAQAVRQRADLRFACIGDGTAAARIALEKQTQEPGLAERFVWPEFETDMSAVYSALDVATLCSAYGEGFPNSVAEAMSCGLPCVTTNVGDAALILGDLGWVVPPGNPRALADAWLDALAQGSDPGIRQRRRDRIEELYNLEHMVDKTEQALMTLL